MKDCHKAGSFPFDSSATLRYTFIRSGLGLLALKMTVGRQDCQEFVNSQHGPGVSLELGCFHRTILLAGLEGQRFAELNGDPAQITMYVIDAADMCRADEIRHIERVVRAKAWNTEARGYLLSGMGTTVVGVAGEAGGIAGDISHLALREDSVKVRCEPDRPTIIESLLPSVLGVFFHFQDLNSYVS